MARYGSERIRGHGIPEAIEAILINGSRVEPRVALLKPLSSAISIGSRRPVRRRGTDHHDRRRLRLDDRAALPPDERRAQDAARRRRGGRHVGDVRGAGRRGAARGRAAALRVEAAQLHSGRAGERDGGGGAPLPASASGRSSRCPPHPIVHRARRAGAAASSPGCSPAGCRRCSPSRSTPPRTPSSACRSTGCGGRRSAASSSASAVSSSRRRSASATTPSAALLQGDVPRRVILGVLVVKSIDLGDLARLGHVGRRARAAADDGRRARRRSRRWCFRTEGVGFWPLVSMGAILGGTMRSPFTGDRLRARADARREHAPAAARRRDARARASPC